MGATNIIALYLFALALKTGPVSTINALYQSSMILSVLAGIFLLNEKENILRKLLGTGITLIGVLLLSSF